MNSPKFLISNYLSNSQPENIEGLRKYLIENSIMSKDYPEDGLILIYHKFDIPSLTEVERECRSLVIDRNTLKMVAYSCETPIMNMCGMDLVMNSTKQSKQPIITECWEGSLLSMYKFNDKWRVSSRRCLDAKDSHVNNPASAEQNNLYDMMMEVLQKSGYETFSDFTDKLNPEMSYYWVLIHHKNKHTIDYTSRLGENYTRMCLISMRDSLMNELDFPENQSYLGEHIFISPLKPFSEIADYTNFSLKDFGTKPTIEGLAIKVWDDLMNKYNLVKIQTPQYQYNQILGFDNNTIKGLVYLYQNGKLGEYLTNHPEASKIQNPTNKLQIYDTVGVIDSAFKACASELFELFKLLWSIQTGQKIPEAKGLYESLPKDYRNMMYNVKGLYYKKKSELYNHLDEVNTGNVKNYHLKPSDIYNYLKGTSTETLTHFWKARKTMMETPELRTIFPQIQTYCDKIQLKLFAILTNILSV